MTRTLSHDDAFASLEAAALGALTAEEEQDVVAHAAGCPECGPALAALRDVAAGLALTADPARMDPDRSAALRARLLGRTKSDKEVLVIAPMASGTFQRPDVHAPNMTAPSRARWMALAAGIAFLASTTLLALTWLDRARLREALDTATTNQTTLTARADSLSAALADNERLLAAVSGPRVRVFNLTAAGPSSPLGKMFWDQATARWTLFAHFLPAPRQGRTYQLWLVSKGAKISAGTFQPDAKGDAIVRAEYALAANALDGIAVTEEPAGGAVQPTGAVVLAATGR